MSLLSFLICAVAAWRLAFMLVQEDGPWAVFHRLRNRTTLGGLLSCVYCSTVWTAALIMVLYFIGGLAQLFVVVLALSGGGLMLAAWTGAGYVGGEHG